MYLKLKFLPIETFLFVDEIVNTNQNVCILKIPRRIFIRSLLTNLSRVYCRNLHAAGIDNKTKSEQDHLFKRVLIKFKSRYQMIKYIFLRKLFRKKRYVEI